MSDSDLDYYELYDNLPYISEKFPEIAEYLDELYQIHKDSREYLEGYYSPR